MPLIITSLNSGSNGNCYYLGNEQEAILIDAGISCRETERRMERLGLAMEKVKAIFVSHEHTDHIKGIPVLVKKYQIPVYITPQTLEKSRMNLGNNVHPFFTHEAIKIGNLSIQAFKKSHDACDPHSFTVSDDDVKVGVFTDIGTPCANLIAHFQQCHAAFLEANYDDELLENGRYPIYLKNRIRGGMGHLSNRQALALFKDFKPPFMSYLLLAHLSKENNDPELVQHLFEEEADQITIVVASRFSETAVYEIGINHEIDGSRGVENLRKEQLSLF